MATRVILNGSPGMRLHSKNPSILSDDDDGVQSGSATGFSDDFEDATAPGHVKKSNMSFDPVTQILDKIDAELSNLTRSQSSSTATDSTVVRRPTSHLSSENSSRLDNGDSLTMSQLGGTSKPIFSPLSSSSRAAGSTDRDTGIGTATSSLTTLDSRRSRSVDDRPPVRDLEPGDSFKSNQRTRALSPDFSYMNGHHIGQSDDDKSKQENQTESPFEAKQVDDKFKEIMQKRKGGLLSRTGTDDDNQTIRTEDFVDKFQDTLVYSSADEAEKIRNLEDDLRSDGGSDTDTLQQKLATLTRTPLPHKDGRSSPCPLPRPLDRQRRKVAQSLDTKPKKVGGPGTPPVYPKPTPTSSLPRPSTRSSLKFTPGHTSDADSVRTEDFENRFKDMMIGGNNTGESDFDTAMNDPIHNKVKQLLKATAKYEEKPAPPHTTSILKSRYRTLSDKPKPDFKPKPHVTISPKPPQYQEEDKGDESDDTLISDKDARVHSPRSWSGLFWKPNVHNNYGLNHDFTSGQFHRDKPSYQSQVSNSSSLDESLSKSSHSLSLSSASSGDKEKFAHRHNDPGGAKFLNNNAFGGFVYTRQGSQLSSAESVFSSSSLSDCPETSNTTSYSSTSESPADEGDRHRQPQPYWREGDRSQCFPSYQTSTFPGALRRRSVSEPILLRPYTLKKSGNDNMKHEKKHERKTRDLIVQEDEEDEIPFSKYTFNKKANGRGSDDSSSIKSSVSHRSSSRDSICSTGVMNQLLHLQKGGKRLMNNSSSASLYSSSSFNDTSGSTDDFSGYYDSGAPEFRPRQTPFLKSQISNASPYTHTSMDKDVSMPIPNISSSPYGYASPGHASPTPGYQPTSVEQVLSNLGFNDSHSFLPERFLKSWMDKVYMSQQEEYSRQMMPPLTPQHVYRDQYSYPDDHDLPPSVSAQQSGQSTPMWRTSFENSHSAMPGEMTARGRRQHLQRVNTINTSGSYSQPGSLTRNSLNSLEDHGANMYSNINPLPLKKENSFDKLKRILQSTDRVVYREKDAKRSAFSSNRQKSLPIFLETLSEEDEEKRRSRTPSFDNSRIAGVKLLNPHDELDRGSRSSDDNSDATSRRSSINQGSHLTDVLLSVRKSLSAIDSESEHSEGRGVSSAKACQEKTMNFRDSVQSIPSIYVSGKDVERENERNKTDIHECQCENVKRNMTKSIQYEQTHDKSKDQRPKSPTPLSQGKKVEGVSKDSLEIAEIFSPKDKNVPSISVLTKLDSFSEDSRERSDLTNHQLHVKQNDSNNYLRISDLEDKYLSPTPSTASPISPITVIEMDRLDDHKESDEVEELCRQSAHGTGGTPSLQYTDNRSTASLKDNKTNKSGSPRQKSNSPHSVNSLVLERRSYQAEPNSDSDKNLSEENLEIDEDTMFGAKSVQADIEELAPLIKMSDITSLLNHFLRKLPQSGSGYDNNLFYLAQDKEVQCEILTEKNLRESSDNKRFVTVLSPVNMNICSTMTESSAEISTKSSEHGSEKEIAGNREVHFNCHDTVLGATKSIPDEQKQEHISATIYKSEAFFILNQESSDYSDTEMNEVVWHDDTKNNATQVNTAQCKDSVQEARECYESDDKATVDTDVCKIVTVTPEDVSKPDDTIEKDQRTALETGFEDMIKSYITFCKQGISETTGEIKSPNSLTVERFEFEPWDSHDLKKVVDVLDRNEITFDVDELETINENQVSSCRSYSFSSSHDENKNLDDQRHETNTVHGHVESQTPFAMDEAYRSTNEVALVRSSKRTIESISESEYVYAKEQGGALHQHEEKVTESETEQRESKGVTESENRELKTVEKTYTSKAVIVLQGMSMPKNNISNGDRDDDGSEKTYRNTVYLDTNKGSYNQMNESVHSCSNKRHEPTFLTVDGRSATANNSSIHSQSRTITESSVSVQMHTAEAMMLQTMATQLSGESATTSSTSTLFNSTRETVKSLSDCHASETLTSSDDQVHSDQELLMNEDNSDILHRFKQTETLESLDSFEDIVVDKLSSRSLDFDTFDTRRHILKRCNGTSFSRSFDMLGSLSSDNEFIDTDTGFERKFVRNSKHNFPEMGKNNSAFNLVERNGKVCEHESSNDHCTTTKKQEEQIQYQLGLKYDDDGNCVDIYGRLRVVKSDTDSSIEEENSGEVTRHNFDDRNEALAENTQYLRQNVFDMFAQIDEDEEGGKVLSETDKTLKELEKLYKMSVDDDYIYHDKTYRLDVGQNGLAARRQSYSSIMEELDHEIGQMESYHEKFQYYETHVCRNCGHTVTISTTEASKGDIDHDYCRECSPLDLTAEMLEKRRMQKLENSTEA